MAKGIKYKPANAIEREYATALRKLAKTVAGIIDPHVSGYSLVDERSMFHALANYALALRPWADNLSRRMVDQVRVKSWKDWKSQAEKMGIAYKQLAFETSVGMRAHELQAEQVELITSIPLDAGERVQRLAMEAITNGQRSSAISEELIRTEHVTKSRATMIARTETAKANAVMTQARAEDIGSEGYIWETSGDGDVRESHRAMDGVYVRYDSPPTLDKMTGHAGSLPNCRCWQRVVLPTK